MYSVYSYFLTHMVCFKYKSPEFLYLEVIRRRTNSSLIYYWEHPWIFCLHPCGNIVVTSQKLWQPVLCPPGSRSQYRTLKVCLRILWPVSWHSDHSHRAPPLGSPHTHTMQVLLSTRVDPERAFPLFWDKRDWLTCQVASFLFIISLGDLKGRDFWRKSGFLVVLGGTKAGIHTLSLSCASTTNPAVY